ncbi:MAG: DUF6152 family protein [Acidobacteriota bacterium]|nr:DUF6152 family protein [Acidobacteriota bacterium]
MRIKSLLVAVSAAVAGCALSVPLWAHHSFAAEFDGTAVVTLKGVITKVERINPHGWIYIDVKSPDGSVTNWAVETGAPNALARLGIKKDSLPVGMEVVISGFRAKDGSNAINGNKITRTDGTDFMLGSSNGAASGSQNRGDTNKGDATK